MKREIKFQIIYANQIDGYERLIEKDGHIFWQWMCLEMNPANSEKWISGVYPKQYKYIRRQFTGLTDKNGKEIYEGDIMKQFRPADKYLSEKTTIGVVIWASVRCAFVVKEIDKFPSYHDIVSCDKDRQVDKSTGIDYTHEIIGNIYENPELL